MRIRQLFQAAIIVGTVAFSGLALAEDAKAFVEREQTKIATMLGKSAQQGDLSNAMAAIVDYDTMTRKAFGRHWDGLGATRQAEVSVLLRQLIENNYKRNLKKTLDYKTDFGKVVGNGDEARVKMKAKSLENNHAPPVTIEYVMRPEAAGWKIVDLVTEGSSLTANYYSQFDEMLTNKDKGYDYLVQKLRSKVAKG